jgi:uncharacterized protein
MEAKIVYFDDIGPDNTDLTFGLVRDRLAALGIKKVVLASTTGATAKKAMDFLADTDVKLVVVGHQWDFHREQNPFPQDLVQTMRDAGHHVHFGTMIFHTDGLYESRTPILMGNLLRCFGQGVKVCFEITLMATDAGYLTSGEKVIAVAGTAHGSDTALVIQAASTQHLTRLRVNEMICKPLDPLNIDELREKMAREKPKY